MRIIKEIKVNAEVLCCVAMFEISFGHFFVCYFQSVDFQHFDLAYK